MENIKKNAIKCNTCNDIVESTHRHDFKYCTCGAVAVDGGLDYVRRVGTNYTELSEWTDNPTGE